MDYLKLERALKFASKTNWEHFQDLFTKEPHYRWGTHPEGDFTRKVAADAYTDDTGDEEGAALLRNPAQHVIVHNGKVRRGMFTTGHLEHALRQVIGHLDDWNTGNDYLPPLLDLQNVSGGVHFPYEGDTEEFPEGHVHPYGTYVVNHIPENAPDTHPITRHYMHISELPHHLAHEINSNMDDGFDTDEEQQDEHDRLIRELRNTPIEHII